MKFKKVYIEITNHCNLSCPFCSHDIRAKRWMSVEEFSHILKEVKPYTKTIYLHVKGEPLLHPKLDEILQVADKNDFRVNITTNATLLSKKIDLLNRHSCVKKINISLHAEYHNKEIYEQIWDSVSLLRSDIIVIYRLWTLKDYTLNEEYTELVERLSEYYRLSPETVEKIKLEENIKLTSTIYVDKQKKFTWPEKTNHKSCGYCMALKTQIAILVDGTVVPCCLDSNGVVSLGNIYKQEFSKILNSSRLLTLKKSFQNRNPSEELCQSCTYKERFTNEITL